MGQDYKCAAEIVNSKNDSLFNNKRDYVINALKYKKLTRRDVPFDSISASS